jgi:hypothetical protein
MIYYLAYFKIHYIEITTPITVITTTAARIGTRLALNLLEKTKANFRIQRRTGVVKSRDQLGIKLDMARTYLFQPWLNGNATKYVAKNQVYKMVYP